VTEKFQNFQISKKDYRLQTEKLFAVYY